MRCWCALANLVLGLYALFAADGFGDQLVLGGILRYAVERTDAGRSKADHVR